MVPKLIEINNESLKENVISEKDKKLIVMSNDTVDESLLELSNNETVVSLFEKQVESDPNNIALIYKDNKFTYFELNEKANILANHLLNDESIGDFVALKLKRSPSMIISILGVLKSGKAYAPLATNMPIEREKHVLKEIKVSIILDDIYVGNILSGDDDVIVSNPNLNIDSDCLAYVIYTSGTTSNPKGVMIKHGSIVNEVKSVSNLYFLGENEVIAFFANYIFDASVEQIFISLLNGYRL
ncbi:MAG: AMP-binding protein [Methanobrevibacter sp.]|jgi:non-ribosomal peptide synthetase component F|nr:AMP-binding protein [Methanobrevibacter sp.]